MNVHFYRFEFEDQAEIATSNLAAVQFSCWRPATDGPPPKGSRNIANYFWWLLEKLGGFASPDFAELKIEQGGLTIHRLIVSPRWYRFPFMAKGDLQIGDLWTLPSARRRQLARAAIAEAHRRFPRNGASFWIVASADNAISLALARSCGYRLAAVGRRTRRFGFSLFGQFVLDRFVHCRDMDTKFIAPDCGDESAAGRSLSVSH